MSNEIRHSSHDLEDHVLGYVDNLRTALDKLDTARLAHIGDILYRAYRNDKQVFVVGNGGSASTASHIAADLAKNTISAHLHRFRITSLTDNVATITALANDIGYDSIFSEQLMNHIRPGDVLMVVTGSGKSPNVLKAMHYARSQSAQVVGLLGFDGGPARELCDVALIAPSDDYGVIEDIHLVINHVLVSYFAARLERERPWMA